MGFSSRTRYTSRRDRLQQHGDRFRWIVWMVILIGVMVVVRRWSDILDYLQGSGADQP